MKKVLILPDSQFGSEDRKLHDKFLDLIIDLAPDKIIHVGDLLDCHAPSRWTRATADEFAGTLQTELDRAVEWLKSIREVYDGPFHIKQGNHDERIEMYLERQAPALSSLRDLRIEALLHLPQLSIKWERDIFPIAPGWVCAHGNEGRMSQVSGITALTLAKRVGASLVCGHTHRAGLVSETSGYGGKNQTVWGMEVGHAMSMRQADYLHSEMANWQQAFGILWVDGKKVYPQLVPVHSGRGVLFTPSCPAS